MERKFIIITIWQHIGEQIINNFIHSASAVVLKLQTMLNMTSGVGYFIIKIKQSSWA